MRVSLTFIAAPDCEGLRKAVSVDAGARLLDDFRPLHEFGFDVGAELLAGVADRDYSVRGQAASHVRGLHDLHDVRAEGIENVFRRTGRREQPVPLARL